MPDPDRPFADAVPLAGGYSGETFLVTAGGEEAVLRVYGRDPGRALVDAALLRLVRGLVPVPTVLDVRPATADPAFLLMSREPGERLDLVLEHADTDLRARIADSVVGVLARLSGMPYVRPGAFVDAELRPSGDPAPAHGLVEWLDLHAVESSLAAWPHSDLDALRSVCLEADALLDSIGRTCLVHSDFNGKNILVDPTSGRVTALLDWEFAHAGLPYTDLGNLLRFHRDSQWEADVLARVGVRLPDLAADPLPLARAADLWALIELAGRSRSNPVADRADRVLRTVAHAQLNPS